MSDEINTIDIRATDAKEAARLCSLLTEHERETLALSAKGYSAKEVGRLIGMSSKSVDFYRANIMAKLGVGSTIEAAVIAAKAALA